jgi:hypothetical protein
VLAYLASAAVFALGPNAIVLTYAATPALFATGFIVAVHANSTPFTFFAHRSNSTVRTNTAALALLATSLRAVVNAKITGRRALPALVFDFVVWANVWAVALSTHCVSKARILQDDHV